MGNDAVEAKLIGDPIMYFSYGQFMTYDRAEKQPGSLWTDDHVLQGFVRRQHSISFGTLFSEGSAELAIYVGKPEKIANYERVVCVPIMLSSGELRLEGPEEYPIERMVLAEPGSYRVCVAQKAIDDDSLQIDVFIESATGELERSSIVKADDQLRPQRELLETGDVAQ